MYRAESSFTSLVGSISPGTFFHVDVFKRIFLFLLAYLCFLLLLGCFFFCFQCFLVLFGALYSFCAFCTCKILSWRKKFKMTSFILLLRLGQEMVLDRDKVTGPYCKLLQKKNSLVKKPRPIEIPHKFFFNTLGNFTRILIDPWNFHMFYL